MDSLFGGRVTSYRTSIKDILCWYYSVAKITSRILDENNISNWAYQNGLTNTEMKQWIIRHQKDKVRVSYSSDDYGFYNILIVAGGKLLDLYTDTPPFAPYNSNGYCNILYELSDE